MVCAMWVDHPPCGAATRRRAEETGTNRTKADFGFIDVKRYDGTKARIVAAGNRDEEEED